MSEIYRNSQGTVTLEVPVLPVDHKIDIVVYSKSFVLSPSASALKTEWVDFATIQGGMTSVEANGMTVTELVDKFGASASYPERLYTAPTVTITDTPPFLYTFSIPLFLTQNDQDLKVEWSFNYVDVDGKTYLFKETTNVSIVTPILSLVTIIEILGSTTTNSEAMAVERMVRHIISAHTGQNFGLLEGSKLVSGKGGNTIALPARLLELTKVNGMAVSSKPYRISGSGWYLTTPDWGVPGIKADYYGLHEINGQISNPNGVALLGFHTGFEYTVEGKWGWYEVPEAIKEAARLLVNDYACNDSVYRDRYLNVVSASDWRVEFNAGAFAQTGNVRADQLLSNFVLKRGWAVV
jgi:hypothetical protein